MPKESGDFKAIVGANIRNLREFYGETQEQLAQIVGCSVDGGKNCISQYERGINLPHAETLRLIAAHYFVDVDSLLEENRFRLPKKGMLQDPRAFREKFVSWFPIVSTAVCEKNDLFVRACSRQRTLYSCIANDEAWDDRGLDEMYDGYTELLENDEVGPWAAANLLSLILLLASVRLGFAGAKLLPAGLKDMPRPAEMAAVFDRELREAAEETEEALSDPEIREWLNLLVTIMKRDPGLQELTVYYAALRFVVIIDGDFSEDGIGLIGQNQLIGGEMMRSLSLLGNPYARAFLDAAVACIKVQNQASVGHFLF